MTEKVSRDDYFTAAFELLAAGGKSALTTTAVCRRIGVTTGSLYHHFGSGAAFYRAVIDYWENDVTVAQRRRVDAVADPRERLATLEQAAREADHEVEKAIRSWAMADRYVAAAQQRVDQVRHEHLTKHYIEAGFTPARAKCADESPLNQPIWLAPPGAPGIVPVHPKLLSSQMPQSKPNGVENHRPGLSAIRKPSKSSLAYLLVSGYGFFCGSAAAGSAAPTDIAKPATAPAIANNLRDMICLSPVSQ
ncbi:Putative transcriptional regulator%2C TetR family [Mycobacteroides abscessus]|nr:Putative transcriptional regulator%2C TetR family [Mycobacteroides abscessus]